ncbi:hypothetical protein OIV83_004157 [Microbotryomycetes sp. JL201]|nr:hypothetical protein OIV83_004157 [Microbotryomycetes sp. JL201]
MEMPHPSDIYGRPTAPSEIHLQFSDDATIAPDDSVSQLGRRFTGRGMLGPRPIPSSSAASTSPVQQALRAPTTVQESTFEPSEVHQWVPPEMIQDDRSTVVAPVPGAFTTTNLVAEVAQTPETSAPSTLPAYRSYEDEDDHQDIGRTGTRAPLVKEAAGLAGYTHSTGQQSAVSAYKPRGYAAVDRDDAEETPYAAYRARNPILATAEESASRKDSDFTATGGVSRWTNPLGYVRSSLGSKSFARDKDEYSVMPGSFELLSSSNGVDPRASLQSLDVAERQDRPDSCKTAGWQRVFWDQTPASIRIEERRRGIGIQRWPFASWGLSLIFAAVLVYELIRMAKITGSAIQTKPSFNPMIGGSIRSGIDQPRRTIRWVYEERAKRDRHQLGTMSDICGFGGFATPQDAKQSFRFFVPIFLHAGVVHLLVNMLVQCFSSAMVEKMMGTPKFLVLYLLSGIFGFVLGANYALVGQPSVGASGAIFGTQAAFLVDLLAHWSLEHRPGRKLIWLVIELIAGLALGLVPGIDNFAHLGGMLMGLLVAIVLLPVIHQSKPHRIVFWILRAVAIPLIIILFVVLVRDFYTSDPASNCSWCRYLSCIPTSSNNKCQGTGLGTASIGSNSISSILTIVFTSFVLPAL